MAKLCISQILQKVRIDYSGHGRYKGVHIVFSLFSLLSSPDRFNIINYFQDSLVLVNSIQKGNQHTGKKHSNWRKEPSLCL